VSSDYQVGLKTAHRFTGSTIVKAQLSIYSLTANAPSTPTPTILFSNDVIVVVTLTPFDDFFPSTCRYEVIDASLTVSGG